MAERDLILCYHRVLPEAQAPWADPQLLCVSSEHLDAHLTVIGRRHAIVSLDALLEDRGAGGRVAITFDDGYEDNLLFAAPVLARHAAPATVYAVAGPAAAGEPFWWDLLAALLLPESPDEAANAPETIRLTFDDQDWTVSLPAPPAGGGPPPRRRELIAWNVLSPGDPTPWHAAYRQLYPRLLALPPRGRERALTALRRALGRQQPELAARPMTPAQLALLDACPGMAVEAHTMGHPVLASLGAREQEEEIVQGARTLAAMTGRPPRHFSYPYGSTVHYDQTAVSLVRAAGFASAVTTTEGPVRPDSSPLELPRVLARDWSADEFAARLKEWMA